METEELDAEAVLVLLGSVPERLADLVAGLDENQLRYRHAPAFPTLLELISHLTQAGAAVDALLRRVQLDGQDRLDVRGSIDPAAEPGGSGVPVDQQLEDYARIRRRSIDLLRGIGPEGWDRRLADSRLGALSLLEVVQLITRHELGHLTQVRNLTSVLPESQDLGPPPGDAGRPGPPSPPPSSVAPAPAAGTQPGDRQDGERDLGAQDDPVHVDRRAPVD